MATKKKAGKGGSKGKGSSRSKAKAKPKGVSKKRRDTSGGNLGLTGTPITAGGEADGA